MAGRIQLRAARSGGASTAPRRASAPGLVVTNPPYGKRLGEVSELTGLYETLGERLKQSFSGWEAAVFTANPELSAHLGLRAHRVNVLFNGPLEAKLLVFDIGPAFAADRPAAGGRRGAAAGAAAPAPAAPRSRRQPRRRRAGGPSTATAAPAP